MIDNKQHKHVLPPIWNHTETSSIILYICIKIKIIVRIKILGDINTVAQIILHLINKFMNNLLLKHENHNQISYTK